MIIGEFDIDERLQSLVGRIVDSYTADPRTRHIDRGDLPGRSEIIHIIELLLEASYPGYFGRKTLTSNNMRYHVGDVMPRLAQALYAQILRALCHRNESDAGHENNGAVACRLRVPEEPRVSTRAARILYILQLDEGPIGSLNYDSDEYR